MQQKTISRIAVVLFLFVFGFVCFRTGVFFIFPFIDPTGVFHLFLTIIGAFCIVLAIYLVKKNWF